MNHLSLRLLDPHCRQPAYKFRNHWQILTSFYGSLLSLGPLLVILVRDVREDYANHVEGFLLQPVYPGRLLFPRNFTT